MKKGFRKISSIALTFLMVFAMNMTVFAADGDTPNSNYNGTGEGDTTLAVQSTANEISISKDIVLYNAEGSQIYVPNVTYSYLVAPAGTTANSVKITGIILEDTNSPHKTTTVTVKNGIAGGVLLANAANGTGANTTTLTFANSDGLANTLAEGTTLTTANASGAKVSKNLYIQFKPDVIYNNGANKAGIYRYKITDNTTRDTLAAAGILRNDAYDASYQNLYLDVYLKNKVNATTGAITGLEVYGYVLFKSGTEDTAFQYVSGSAETYKLTGFNTDSELGGTSGTDVISDQYHTYNVDITKTTTGALADKDNYFPFNIELTEATGTTATKVHVTYTNAQNVKDGSDVAIATDTGTNLSAGGTATNFSGEIKDGGNIKFTGIPTYVNYAATTPYNYATTDYATANAKETNNTYDDYSATATVDGETTTNVALAYKATSSAASTTVSVAADNYAAVISNTGDATLNTALTVDGLDSSNSVVANSIDFTNTLEAISPTGFVVRFAPYALVLICGILLIAIGLVVYNKTNKKETA